MSHNSFQTMKVWSICMNSLTTLFCCMFLIWQLIIAKLFWVVVFFRDYKCFFFFQEERIYLRVLLPFGSKEQEQPLFFSKVCSSITVNIHYYLYNSPSHSRILIGSHLWSIRGQRHDWCHQSFFLLHFKMAERSEN